MELSLLLVGRDGNGKSSTGNSILGGKPFTPTSNRSSVGVDIQQASATVGGRVVTVTEVSGLEYPGTDNTGDIEDTLGKIEKTIAENEKGFNAVIIVLKFGARFIKREKDALLIIRSIFGSNMIKDFGVVVITNGDCFDVEDDKRTFEEWCQDHTGDVKTLFDDCGSRCVLFNNRTKDKEKMEAQRQKLFSEVASISHPYTLDEYDKAVTGQTEILVQSKLPKIEKNKNDVMSEVWTELDKIDKKYPVASCDFLELGRLLSDLEEKLLELRRFVTEEDKNTGVLQRLLYDIPVAEMRIHTKRQIAEQKLQNLALSATTVVCFLDGAEYGLQKITDTISIKECLIDKDGITRSNSASGQDVSRYCLALVEICKTTSSSQQVIETLDLYDKLSHIRQVCEIVCQDSPPKVRGQVAEVRGQDPQLRYDQQVAKVHGHDPQPKGRRQVADVKGQDPQLKARGQVAKVLDQNSPHKDRGQVAEDLGQDSSIKDRGQVAEDLGQDSSIKDRGQVAEDLGQDSSIKDRGQVAEDLGQDSSIKDRGQVAEDLGQDSSIKDRGQVAEDLGQDSSKDRGQVAEDLGQDLPPRCRGQAAEVLDQDSSIKDRGQVAEDLCQDSPLRCRGQVAKDLGQDSPPRGRGQVAEVRGQDPQLRGDQQVAKVYGLDPKPKDRGQVSDVKGQNPQPKGKGQVTDVKGQDPQLKARGQVAKVHGHIGYSKPNNDLETTKRMFKTIINRLKHDNLTHVICLISKYEQKLTKEEIDVVIEKVKTTYGTNEIKNHSILILTCDNDNLEAEKAQMLEDWLKEETGANQRLLNACGNRCLLLNPGTKNQGTLRDRGLASSTRPVAYSGTGNASQNAEAHLPSTLMARRSASSKPNKAPENPGPVTKKWWNFW